MEEQYVKNSKIADSTVAIEEYVPDLSEKYQTRFTALVEKLGSALPHNRNYLLEEELKSVGIDGVSECADIDLLKYMASISLLKDLSLQGWQFRAESGKLHLFMNEDNLDDKAHIRYRLSAERNAQFKTESIKKFIIKMETPRLFKGEEVSIKNLIGNKDMLIQRIREEGKICDPYIQLVTQRKDEHTGIELSDIWRYFRYTWAIPYKTMPGRNLFYLVRDRAQKYHPIIGIFALGNSVLNLSVRDEDIGWTVEAIKRNMQQKVDISFCEQEVSGTDGGKIKAKIVKSLETDEEYALRIQKYSNKIMPLLIQNIDDAIDDIYTKDLGYHRNTKYPKAEYIETLISQAIELEALSINNKNNEKNPNWIEETQKPLFKKKRATELAKLLKAKKIFVEAPYEDNTEKLQFLLSKEEGRQAINTALIANRKCKIGSNMMDIIVCGSIPPYNELLGGKLVSILACSPTVIRDYTHRYAQQVSEIASRMKGKRVVRDSRLVYLGTTSLYAIGSSQYNRIKVPLQNGSKLEYAKMGITEGFGTVYFSNDTSSLFSRILEIIDGGKKINHVFGEGTSPRFRMISRGLKAIGIRADAFLKHYSPRIVYSINLANNTNDFLLGIDQDVEYGFNIEDDQDVQAHTQYLIDYWYKRWLEMRITSVDIEKRLEAFDIMEVLLSTKC
ncbi:DUF4338 domain-containing protein [Clostridiaceae bacterium TF01-6]|nr:DUF4338 domain-containing protein [Clostridiaceae bacterium TF01-6]